MNHLVSTKGDNLHRWLYEYWMLFGSAGFTRNSSAGDERCGEQEPYNRLPVLDLAFLDQ